MSDWLDRAPAMLRDAGMDANGDPDPTSQDRRWLWRLEQFLAIHGTNPDQRRMGSDLHAYLNETCEHHWQSWPGDEDIPAHDQCSWCNDVTWKPAAS